MLTVTPPPIVAIAAPGTEQIILAKPGPDVLLIWNAQATIAGLASKSTDKQAALRKIKSEAVGILIQKKSSYGTAKTITLRVIYPHAPEMNPQYNLATLGAVEYLMTLRADISRLRKSGAAWMRQLGNGKDPNGLRITVTGVLPPTFR